MWWCVLLHKLCNNTCILNIIQHWNEEKALQTVKLSISLLMYIAFVSFTYDSDYCGIFTLNERQTTFPPLPIHPHGQKREKRKENRHWSAQWIIHFSQSLTALLVSSEAYPESRAGEVDLRAHMGAAAWPSKFDHQRAQNLSKTCCFSKIQTAVMDLLTVLEKTTSPGNDKKN